MTGRVIRFSGILLVAVLLAGCAGLVTQPLANSVSSAILNQDDPETVRTGAPAYLLLVDGLITENPRDVRLLTAGARLYGAYSTVFVDDGARARHMAAKSREFGRRAICQNYPRICQLEGKPYDLFLPALQEVGASDIDALYVYATSWAGWIQAASGDWGAVADLPKVEAALRRVVSLDDTYANGQAHLYLGVLNTLLPPALGGRPEVGRGYFERAIELSQGRDLMAKVEYARRYARMVFERDLHDRLLKGVLEADPHVHGLTLSNVLAQQEAARLLRDSREYFQE